MSSVASIMTNQVRYVTVKTTFVIYSSTQYYLFIITLSIGTNTLVSH